MKGIDKLHRKHQHAGWTPGGCLQKARKQAGFSQEKIAKHLHLRLSIIKAIENDQYDQIEELVFIRGYLRAYASLLNLPADEIIHAFNALESSRVKPEALSPIENQDKAVPGRQRNHRMRGLRWIIYLSVVILMTFAFIRWYHQTDSEPQNDAQATLAIQDGISSQ